MRLFIIAVAGFAVLSGCGGGSGGITANELVDLSGSAAKGILIGADVSVYAVIDGKPAAVALAKTKTDSKGEYSLQVPTTSGPLIVEVKANKDTQMLDETQLLVSGEFAKVAPPSNLTLRSFAASATQVTSVRVNPYTEMAVAVAAKTEGGLTTNSLIAGQEMAKLAAPRGVNPFTQIPVSKPTDMDSDQMKFAMQMAGLLSAAKANPQCALDCQVANLSKDIALKLNADGTAAVPGSVKLAIQEKKAAVISSGVDTLKVAGTQTATLAQTKAAVTAEATAAIADAKANQSTSTSTAPPTEVLAANGLQGFVDAMRNGFRTTENRLLKTEEDLNKRYENVTLSGVSFVGKVLDAIDEDCDSEAKKCTTSSRSLFNWTGNGDNYAWVTKNPDSEGRTSSGTVVGTFVDGGRKTVLINGSIFKSGKVLASMNNVEASITENGSENFTATVNGAIQANDSQSNLTVTLNLENIVATSKERINKDIADVTFKGGLSLAASNGDKLSGSLDITMVEVTKQVFYGNNNQWSYNDYDEFVTSGTINVQAVSTASGPAMSILELSFNLTSSLPDYAKPVTSTNVETYNGTVTLALADKLTTLVLTESAKDWKNMSQTATIQSRGSQVTLSIDYSSDIKNGAWCQWNEIQRCANEAKLISNNANPYTATLKKVNGRTTGNIYLGATKVGEIVNGVLKINGSEVSLY